MPAARLHLTTPQCLYHWRVDDNASNDNERRERRCTTDGDSHPLQGAAQEETVRAVNPRGRRWNPMCRRHRCEP
eukprot:4200158-Pyramimonas_sp.AAC.2